MKKLSERMSLVLSLKGYILNDRVLVAFDLLDNSDNQLYRKTLKNITSTRGLVL